jgi:hypothetical protein
MLTGRDISGGAMPWKAKLSGAALDGADDLVGDVLVNVEAFFCHGRSPLLRGPRYCGLVGQKGPGPLDEGSNAAP